MESYWCLLLNPWTIFQAMKVTPAISTKMKSPIKKDTCQYQSQNKQQGL
jgi:hypothetical protein